MRDLLQMTCKADKGTRALHSRHMTEAALLSLLKSWSADLVIDKRLEYTTDHHLLGGDDAQNFFTVGVRPGPARVSLHNPNNAMLLTASAATLVDPAMTQAK